MSDFFLIANCVAMVTGYAVMIGGAAMFIYDTSDIQLHDGIKKFVILGFGVIWFDPLWNMTFDFNARKAGYRLRPLGKYVVALALPRWFVWTAKKITGRNPL